jgi:hypothetical protein
LSRLATSFVLGFHGCSRAVAEKVISGKQELSVSEHKYDWLGSGAYFWESDPRRALEWAKWKESRNECDDPVVIGAVIDLAHCLDLLAREDLEILKDAYASFVTFQNILGQSVGQSALTNRSPKGNPDEDRIFRYLDNAVIRHLHEIKKAQNESYDTVRGMFTEGDELYAGAGFKEKSHTQIAVRNKDCVLGYFWPRPYPKI